MRGSVVRSAQWGLCVVVQARGVQKCGVRRGGHRAGGRAVHTDGVVALRQELVDLDFNRLPLQLELRASK